MSRTNSRAGQGILSIGIISEHDSVLSWSNFIVDLTWRHTHSVMSMTDEMRSTVIGQRFGRVPGRVPWEFCSDLCLIVL